MLFIDRVGHEDSGWCLGIYEGGDFYLRSTLKTRGAVT